MKQLATLLICFCLQFTANGQNFIPNADFGAYTLCPTFFSETANCTDWYQPTWGTSDYFNACSIGTEVGVPNNFAGSQSSASNGYLGLFTYITKNAAEYREYISTSFAPLTIGKKYDITISVSLGDSCNAATDGLGILFTTNAINTITYDAIPVAPQIDFSHYGPITDKTNWVKLTGSFVADSAYTNLTIGNFKPYASLIIAYNSAPKYKYWDTACYYYIGLIQVADSTGLPPPATCVYPSAFTPNSDGLNDLFKIIGGAKERCNNYSLSIYNRWGERVFLTTDVHAGWNGVYNGINQGIGVYFYMASYVLDGYRQLQKGDITLIR